MMDSLKMANQTHEVEQGAKETTAQTETSLKSEENKMVGSEELQQFSTSMAALGTSGIETAE